MRTDEITIGIAATEGGAVVVVCSRDNSTGVVTVLKSASVKAYQDSCIRIDLSENSNIKI